MINYLPLLYNSAAVAHHTPPRLPSPSLGLCLRVPDHERQEKEENIDA